MRSRAAAAAASCYAFRLLGPERRAALYAVYAFCRFVDDIADDLDAGRATPRRCWRAGARSSTRVYAGTATHPIGIALADAARRFALAAAPLHRSDPWRRDGSRRAGATRPSTSSTSTATWSPRRSGSCASRSSATGIRARADYALDLGVAFQLTNILRDVREDGARGPHLPAAGGSARASTATRTSCSPGATRRASARCMAFECGRARAYYLRARGVAGAGGPRARSRPPRRCAGSTSACSARIEARHFDVFGQRITLPRYEKVTLALAAWGRAQLPAWTARVMRDVVVIGGGFAGLSAGVALAERGARVTMLEARPHLGGRAYSFRDAATGTVVDNGQHAMMGCYAARWRSSNASARAARCTGRRACTSICAHPRLGTGVIACPPWPSPLHLAGGLLRYRLLSRGERLRALRAGMRAAWRCGGGTIRGSRTARWTRCWSRSGSRRMRGRASGTRSRSRRSTRRPSAPPPAPFVEVLARAFFGSRRGFAVRPPACRPQRSLHRRRAALRRASRRTGVDSRPGGGTRRATTARCRPSSCATAAGSPPTPASRPCRRAALARFLPSDLRAQPAFARLDGLETSPIVSDHLWFDRPVLRGDFVGLLGTTTQWVFNRTRLLGERRSGAVRERRHQRRARRRRVGHRPRRRPRCWPTSARVLPAAVPRTPRAVRRREGEARDRVAHSRGRAPAPAGTRRRSATSCWPATGRRPACRRRSRAPSRAASVRPACWPTDLPPDDRRNVDAISRAHHHRHAEVAAAKLAGAATQRYPYVLMLEPLHTCNLACLGCSPERYNGDLKDRLLAASNASRRSTSPARRWCRSAAASRRSIPSWPSWSTASSRASGTSTCAPTASCSIASTRRARRTSGSRSTCTSTACARRTTSSSIGPASSTRRSR